MMLHQKGKTVVYTSPDVFVIEIKNVMNLKERPLKITYFIYLRFVNSSHRSQHSYVFFRAILKVIIRIMWALTIYKLLRMPLLGPSENRL